jgi:hypothetical protein
MLRTALLALMLTAPAAAQQIAGPGVERVKAPAQPIGQVAKRAPVNGVLVLYGNERCPTDADGNEVIVCQRRSASEQFRVPKELREFEVTPENAAWAAKAQGTLAAGERDRQLLGGRSGRTDWLLRSAGARQSGGEQGAG